jgi:aminoglycoside 3-N-acetyltransferase I
MSIEIKRLTKENIYEFKLLIHFFSIVFEEASKIGSEANSLDLLKNKAFIALAAVDGESVVGGLTAYELPMYYSDNSEIFLYDLAVRPDHQRLGIGKQLLRGLKEYCLANGIKTFFVMAHEEDIHAIEFYQATGGNGEKVVNFLYESDQ